MNVDLYTVQLATSMVTTVAGVMFILDTFLRRTDLAGRVWAMSFMSGILASFAYGIWVTVPEGWWAVAVGNAAVVLTPALLWCGARAYNGRTTLAWVGLVAAGAAAVPVVAEGTRGGDWAGAPLMFLSVAVFAGLGAVESMRAPMRQNWTARSLTTVFVMVSVFYSARTGVFVTRGPDDPVFATFFGTEASAFVLMAFIVVALVSLIVLQGERVPRIGPAERPSSYNGDGVLHQSSLREAVEDWLERASFHDEQLVLMRVELDELDALTIAFGRSACTQLMKDFTTAVRRFSPPHSSIGVGGLNALIVVAPIADLAQAKASAEALQDGLHEEPREAAQNLRLSASIGIAGTDYFGHDFERLMEAAEDAARTVREAGGNAVGLAGTISDAARARASFS